MREYFPVIKKSALFQGISEDDLDGMLTCLGARTASYSKNQTIFWEGEPASLIGVVLSGKVQIAKDDFFRQPQYHFHDGAVTALWRSFCLRRHRKTAGHCNRSYRQ